MEDPEDLTFSKLELCTYRHLQQVAKSMGLPSNVKKVYLIEMIRAKKYCTAEELDAVVVRIREERKLLSKTRKPMKRRKKQVQGTEISSTSNYSPPISRTPQPSDYLITYPPSIRRTIMKYQHPNITKKAIESDRVLRSKNNRMRPNYSILNVNDSVIGVIKTQNALQQSQDMQERQYELSVAFQRHRPMNIGECVVEIPRVKDYGGFPIQRQQLDFERTDREERQLMPVARSSNISPRPAKPLRRISGIYPLKPSEQFHQQHIPSIGFRRQDGRISKINAVIQKPSHRNNTLEAIVNNKTTQPCVWRNRIISVQDVPRPHMATVQDLLNYEIDQHAISNTSTESVRDSSAERENIPIENINRNENRSNATDMTIRYEENTNHAIENPIKYAAHRSYAAENRYIKTESRNYTETPNRYTSGSCLKQYTNRSGNIMNASENINKSTLVDNMEIRNVETDYPNMSALTDVYAENQITEVTSTSDSNFSVYYHKKIRAEQVRSKRSSTPREQRTSDARLPRITDVFSHFNNAQYRNLTQPLYVQVNDEPETNPPTNSTMLENFYNYKNRSLTTSHEPLLQVVTTSATHCVFTTPIMTTAIAHPSAAVCNENKAHPCERDSQQYNVEVETVPRLYDYLRIAEQERRDFTCVEVLSSSGSSFGETSSQLGANVTIPEMVEDALELISQDGDYMERIEMDVRMQCILCDWAGPKIVLDYHIRKEHSSSIVERESSEWCASFPLGGLARRAWASQLSARRGRLYVLSANYQHQDCFMANLTVLPTVSDEVPTYSQLTVYNKKTGEPHVWEGEITELSDTMPYQTDCNGLKLDITSLDLLPNSANLKLVNGELVVNSTDKVVVGQPELNDIEIAVYVKVFD